MAAFGRQSNYLYRIHYYASTSDLIIVDPLTDLNSYVATDPQLWIVLTNPHKGSLGHAKHSPVLPLRFR